MTIWNESKEKPRVLYDYDNVLNAYSLDRLARAAGTVDWPYAIVSLLATQGDNFEQLRRLSEETKQCVVAITAKFRGNRVDCETGVKYIAMCEMHWNDTVECALDDKPHEWFGNQNQNPILLDLDKDKKPVYCIRYKKTTRITTGIH
jgi:hypothetical protein